ncbi:MAG: hypothetical protein M3Q44_05375 [bacterium]|nr:hypothetical protein [bacterium]
MNTTDDKIKEDEMNASKDYDPGADTDQSAHNVEESDYAVTGRFTETHKYDSEINKISESYIDDEDDW